MSRHDYSTVSMHDCETDEIDNVRRLLQQQRSSTCVREGRGCRRSTRRQSGASMSPAAVRACAAALVLALATVVALAVAGVTTAARSRPGNALPWQVPAAGVAAALRHHSFVALSNPHDEAFERVFNQILRDRRVRSRVQFLVSDCCTPSSQRLLDGYTSGRVPLAVARRAWAPVVGAYPEPSIFTVVRQINASRRGRDMIRILGVHPSLRHGRTNPWHDLLDRTVAEVVSKNVLNAHAHALALLDWFKLDRRHRGTATTPQSAVARIEHEAPGSTYVIWADPLKKPLHRQIKPPAFVAIRGTAIGSLPETVVWPRRNRIATGLVLAPADEHRRLETTIDALLIWH